MLIWFPLDHVKIIITVTLWNGFVEIKENVSSDNYELFYI